MRSGLLLFYETGVPEQREKIVMDHEEQIPRKYPTKEEMLNRVARYEDLKGFDGGLADSNMPSAMRFLYNVIGFQPPLTEDSGVGSPVGALAARMSSIKISEGFNLGYCEAIPGKGPMMHNHDTNETFICMTGKWRASWETKNDKVEHIDLNPLDVISFPPGAIRRFENVTDGASDEYSILMFIISGNAPSAEFTRESLVEIDGEGLLAENPADSGNVDWVSPHVNPKEFRPT